MRLDSLISDDSGQSGFALGSLAAGEGKGGGRVRGQGGWPGWDWDRDWEWERERGNEGCNLVDAKVVVVILAKSPPVSRNMNEIGVFRIVNISDVNISDGGYLTSHTLLAYSLASGNCGK